MKLLRAFRLPNLCIVALTQIILKYVIINPYFEGLEVELFSDLHFVLLVLATLSLTIFGYLINDYFDFDLDLKSDRKVKSGLVRQSLLRYSILFAIVGFILSLLVAIQAELLHLLWIFPIAVGLLYLYSKSLKAQGLSGNILVASFTAGVIYVVLLSEHHIDFEDHHFIQSIVFSFIVFSFLINLYREIIKDVEDMEEDKAFGLQTLPIKIGPARSSLVAFFIGLVLVILMFLFGLFLTDNMVQKGYVFGVLVLSMAYLLYLNHHAAKAEDYHRLSQLVKAVMLFGLVYLFLV